MGVSVLTSTCICPQAVVISLNHSTCDFLVKVAIGIGRSGLDCTELGKLQIVNDVTSLEVKSSEQKCWRFL